MDRQEVLPALAPHVCGIGALFHAEMEAPHPGFCVQPVLETKGRKALLQLPAASKDLGKMPICLLPHLGPSRRLPQPQGRAQGKRPPHRC